MKRTFLYVIVAGIVVALCAIAPRYSLFAQVSGLDTNRVGHWNFDDGSGTTAVDSSGNGRSGTLVNGPTWATGKFNQGLSFDGVNDRVDVAHVSALNAYPLTISTWFKTNSTGGFQGLVNKYLSGSLNGYNLYFDSIASSIASGYSKNKKK